MVHAYWAYGAPAIYPMPEGIAIEAIRIIAKYADSSERGKIWRLVDNDWLLPSMGERLCKRTGLVHIRCHQLGAPYNNNNTVCSMHKILHTALKQKQSRY